MKRKVKNLIFIVVIILSTLLLGIFGAMWLSKNVMELYFQEADVEFESIKKFSNENKEVAKFAIEYSSKVYENATKNFAFLLRDRINDNNITRDELLELSKNVKVDNIIILDRNGKVVCTAIDTDIDFADSKYEVLKKVFNDKNKSTILTLKNNGVTDYYFAAKINDNLQTIVYCDGRNVEGDSEYILSWKNLLLDKNLSNVSNYFILEKNTEKILYNSNEAYIGENIVNNKDLIETEKFKLVEIFDKFGFAKKYSLENADLVTFIYIDEFFKKTAVFIFFTMISFLLCITFLTIYSVIVSEEANLVKEGFKDSYDADEYEKTRKKKIVIITFTIMAVMSFVLLFFNSIYKISLADESTSFYYNKLRNFAERSNINIKYLEEMYDNYCRINNDLICEVLSNHSTDINRENLNRMANGLGLKEIRMLDLNGETICTSNGLDKYKLSKNKEDGSYKCWDLLNEDGFIMLPISYDVKGNPYQYACSTLRDNQHNVSGILMTKYDMNSKLKVVEKLDWYVYSQNALEEEKVFYFMVDKNTNEVISALDEELIGQNVSTGRLPIEVTQGGYEGFLRYEGDKLFGKTLQIDKIVTGVFISLKFINNITIFYILIFILVVIGFLVLYMCFVLKHSKGYSVEVVNLDVDNTKKFAVNRMFVPQWSNITGTQKISLVLSYMFVLLMIFFSIILLFGEKIFGKDSIINYIINGSWHHSLNVLAFSKSVLIISCILLVALVINLLLDILSRSFDARGVTLCKLLSNFVRYAAIFVALYQSLILIGVDAKTLLASAGILSLIVGLGVNKLVQEVVAGLFIIFEGAIQVGDTITIGGFTGIIVEIGIRNTKIISIDGNVMIMSNSHLDSVVNHSTAKTLIVYDYKIPKNISLDECDAFFNSKIDYLKEKLGSIVKDIKYDGIVGYEVDTYTIRFSISCIEESKAKIEYRVDSEMKLLIDELSKKI